MFGLLADGLSGAQIAERLVLSPETVRTHIRNGMSKLGASTRSQAVVLALRRGEIGAGPDATQGQVVTADAAQAGNGTRQTPVEALELVVDGLLRLWDVDAGWVYLLEEDGLTLTRAVERTASADGLPQVLALGEGALGTAALERRSQIVQVPGDERGAMIATPLVDGGSLIGVLGLAVRSSRPTGRNELLLLQALAARIAAVVAGGEPNATAAAGKALAGFRSSWTSATRSV